ncbi:MAG: hypothetical protein KDI09_00585 [Halioglobus sp.]|nr:hypothetical protein [Halioglobus sp.]
MDTTKFIASELSSRKLWQLVEAPDAANITERQLSEAIAELARRRHYLQDLQELGKLGRQPKH